MILPLVQSNENGEELDFEKVKKELAIMFPRFRGEQDKEVERNEGNALVCVCVFVCLYVCVFVFVSYP